MSEFRAPWFRRFSLAARMLAAACAVVAVAFAPLPSGASADQLSPAMPGAHPAPLQQILRSVVRQLQIFYPAGDENIILLKFPSLADQARMLNRVAAFVEKKGAPRDRILSGAELSAFIKGQGTVPEDFYLGHDYAAADVARFFASAARDKLKLNRDEETLRRILIAAKAIRLSGGRYEAMTPAKAVISFAERRRPSTNDLSDPGYATLRCTIFEHELSHGVYFTQTPYSSSVIEFWHNGMTEAERAAFKAFLARIDYDTDIEGIVINEMQAFLMHTPDVREFSAEIVAMPEADLQSLRQRFAAAIPSVAMLQEMGHYCPH
jgi:hypothetical protein